MINYLIKIAKKSRFKSTLKKIYRYFITSYPFVTGKELKAVKQVLNSGIWNMSDPNGVHAILEKEFSEYIGVKHAVVVNSGGVGIQMALRVLDVKNGDEVIHQVDTCVANSFAIMNAGAIPIFSDISLDTFKLDFNNLENLITPRTKVIMPIHLWGNVENLKRLKCFAVKHNLKIIEDCALAFGAEYNGKKVGGFGDVGVFSFGSTKPIQSGEGGIIVTNDDDIAKKLRTMRNWGEMTQEYGVRDHEILSWNGRASEIVVAVMLEQFRNFEKRLSKLERHIKIFMDYIYSNKYLSMADQNLYNSKPSYGQVVVKLDSKIDKFEFMENLKEKKISVWHANFELIPTISFFKNETWKDWVMNKDVKFVESNYQGEFPNAKEVYERLGLGFMPNNFLTMKSTQKTIKEISICLKEMNVE